MGMGAVCVRTPGKVYPSPQNTSLIEAVQEGRKGCDKPRDTGTPRDYRTVHGTALCASIRYMILSTPASCYHKTRSE